MTKLEDAVYGKSGGLVPLQHWQNSLLFDAAPDSLAPLITKTGETTYIDTSHPDYFNWLKGFIMGASEEFNASIKRQTN